MTEQFLLKEQNELLKQLVKNTSPKDSQQIIVRSTKTNFDTNYKEPIELSNEKEYEIALVDLETYYSFPNISNHNNIIDYFNVSTQEVKRITVPKGSYGYTDLVKEINSQLNGVDAFTITANTNTFKTILEIKPNYRVRFLENSLKTVLGFTGDIYNAGTHISENVINIMSITSILIHIDIINGSYVEGSKKPVIYSFYPKVNPGYKIIQKPHNPIYLPIVRKNISTLNVRITDQKNDLLDLRGEEVVIRFHIREK